MTIIVSPHFSPGSREQAQDDIQHLLQYIEGSGGEFERYGTVYDSKETRSHNERKFDHVKSHVDEAEDIIKYAATKSSMSGNKCQVACNGSRQMSADWLHDEPTKFRNNCAAALE